MSNQKGKGVGFPLYEIPDGFVDQTTVLETWSQVPQTIHFADPAADPGTMQKNWYDAYSLSPAVLRIVTPVAPA
jgi:hypothetical protein